LVSITLGMDRTPLVELVYFLLAFLVGVAGAILFHPVFWITIPSTLGCMWVSLTTKPQDITSITNKEYFIYGLIISDAVIKAIFLIY